MLRKKVFKCKENKIIFTYICVFLFIICAAIRCGFYNRCSDHIPCVSQGQTITIHCSTLPKNIGIGDKVHIDINAKLNEYDKTLKNIIYYIEIIKDKNRVSKDQVTLVSESKNIPCSNGKFQIVKEKEVVKDKKYSFKLIFKEKGHYEFKIYAESY